LLSMPLSPCHPYFPAEVSRRFSPCDAPCCLRLKSAGSAFGARIFEVTMGSLTLRPGDSLTILKMALSIGFRIFSFPPSCYSSYGALNFYPGGTDSHCSCQPSLDAHSFIPYFRPVYPGARTWPSCRLCASICLAS
jgi:hypothetical protein